MGRLRFKISASRRPIAPPLENHLFFNTFGASQGWPIALPLQNNEDPRSVVYGVLVGRPPPQLRDKGYSLFQVLRPTSAPNTTVCGWGRQTPLPSASGVQCRAVLVACEMLVSMETSWLAAAFGRLPSYVDAIGDPTVTWLDPRNPLCRLFAVIVKCSQTCAGDCCEAAGYQSHSALSAQNVK